MGHRTDLSVLIPWKSDNGPREQIFEWLLRRYRLLFPNAELCIGTSEPFSRSAARNDAFRQSHGRVLLIADADTIFHVDQVRAAQSLVLSEKTWVLPYGKKGYYNLSEWRTKEILNQRQDLPVPEPRHRDEWEFRLESWAGLLVMTREAFETVGGYPEAFVGWSFEDNAMKSMLDTLWAPHRRLTWGHVEHLWHPISEQDTWKQPHFQANRELYQRYQAAERNPVMMRDLIGVNNL